MPLLTPRTVSLVIESASNASPVDSKALEDARSIISSFTSPNPTSTMFSRLLSIPTKFNDLPPTATSPLIPPSALEEAYNSLTPEVRQSLNNLHSRITAFATMQVSERSTSTFIHIHIYIHIHINYKLTLSHSIRSAPVSPTLPSPSPAGSPGRACPPARPPGATLLAVGTPSPPRC